MSQNRLVSKPPTGLLSFGLRLPIVLFRLGAGWMLGGRFMLIKHVGRKSGQPYQTVVEVVGHDELSNTFYAASGWGSKSSWYRNLKNTPETDIQVGRSRLHVHAETVKPPDGAKVLMQYRQEHPFAARELSTVMGIDFAQASPEALETIVRDSLPIVAFHPAG